MLLGGWRTAVERDAHDGTDQMMYRNPFTPIFIVALLSGGCARSDAPDVAPPTLSILLGQTGAQGGQMQGLRIGADGAVTAWRGRSAGQNPTDRGFISESEGDSLWAWIQEADFFARARQYPGNLTRFLAVTVADSTRRATWPIGPGIGAGDDPIARLYERIMTLVE